MDSKMTQGITFQGMEFFKNFSLDFSLQVITFITIALSQCLPTCGEESFFFLKKTKNVFNLQETDTYIKFNKNELLEKLT